MYLVAITLACLALFFAGIDSATSSFSFWYREASGWLFIATWMLWSVLAMIVLIPTYVAWVVIGRLRPRSERGERRDAVFIGFMLMGAPVITHMGLNAFLPMGAGPGALLSPMPLLGGLLCLLVSIGLAVGLGQLARLKGFRVIGLLGVAGLLFGMLDFSTSEEGGRSTREAPGDAPNLLLMVWDTTRAASLGIYGNDRATAPLLAGRSEGMAVYDEARSTSIFTLTSHISMLTGTYPSHHGARLTRQSYNPAETPSIAELLRDAGYRTGAFVGTAVLNGDTGVGEGFEVFDDRVDPDVCKSSIWGMVHDIQAFLAKLSPQLQGNGRPHWFETFDRPAEDVLSRALAWIDNGDSRPWFCMINMYDGHWPYLPGQAAASQFVVEGYGGTVDGYLFRSNAYRRNEAYPGETLDEKDRQYLVDLYEAEIFELDGKVDQFWASVEAATRNSGRGLGAVVTADHGEAFGENEVFGHSDVQEVQVRVPFLLKAPGAGPGGPESGRRGGKVSSVDIAPTLLSFAGIERPGWMPGLDLNVQQPSAQRVVLVEDRDHLGAEKSQHAVYRGDWKLLVHGFSADGAVELYNLEEDPAASEDVASFFPEVVDELRAVLGDLRSSWGADGGEKAWAGDGAGLADHLTGLGYGGD
ncbi:MAG: sulfatase [Planctomycetes bacterium]|nr:sulfatase [Planctomycetota bacterium]